MKSSKQHQVPTDRSALLDALKFFAKAGKKEQPHQPLAWFQDQIALAFGYGNWSLLHKHLVGMTDHQFEAIKTKMILHGMVGPFLQSVASVFDAASARDEMRDWFRERYTPLIEFAYLDKEFPNGFAWSSVDVHGHLRDNFSDIYPDDLIEEVADKLEEGGPWGVDMDPADAEVNVKVA